MVHQVGHKTMPFPQQQELLDRVRSRLGELTSQGYEILQIDESVFSTKQYNHKCWAPVGNPVTTHSKWNWKEYICSIAAISVEHGMVHYHCKPKAYDREDVLDFLRSIRAMHPGKKLACFMDNASIHVAASKQSAADPTIKMEILFNLSYRPDLQGIELTWKEAKLHYRKYVMSMKPYGLKWDNLTTA